MGRCKKGTAKTCKTVCTEPCVKSKPRKRKASVKKVTPKKKKTPVKKQKKQEVAAVGTGYEKFQNIEIPRMERKYKVREILDKYKGLDKRIKRRSRD